jgi:hypothetical protein
MCEIYCRIKLNINSKAIENKMIRSLLKDMGEKVSGSLNHFPSVGRWAKRGCVEESFVSKFATLKEA